MAVVALASSAFAGHRSVFISSGTTLDGEATIQKGQYDLTWKKNGNPDSYDIRVMNGTKVVAKGTATMVDRGEKAERDAVITKPDDGGKRHIHEIRFRGKTTVLVIDS